MIVEAGKEMMKINEEEWFFWRLSNEINLEYQQLMIQLWDLIISKVEAKEIEKIGCV